MKSNYKVLALLIILLVTIIHIIPFKINPISENLLLFTIVIIIPAFIVLVYKPCSILVYSYPLVLFIVLIYNMISVDGLFFSVSYVFINTISSIIYTVLVISKKIK